MKGPPGRRLIVPMFSRPQRRKLFQSRAANGSELPILEGSPLCAAAGGPGDSSLATSAPNRGHTDFLPPAPNGQQGNRKVVKEKGKGDQGKAESSRWLNAGHVSLEGERPPFLPLENPASNAMQGRLVPLWPEALPGSTSGPREGHLAQDGPGLGGQELGENGRRPPASLTEDKQLGEGLHVALPPSPSREVGQQKGSRAANARFSNMDKGPRTRPKLSGGKKLPGTTGRKAALPGLKRPETHHEAGQEAWIKDLDSLRRRMLQEIPELQALGKQKEDVAAAIGTRQGIAKIQEHLAAPAGALQTAPGALRLPPLPSPFREVEQAKGLGSPKDSTDQMDRGPRLPRKCSPEKKPPGRSAQPGQKTALQDKTRQMPASPEFWIKDLDTLRRRMLQEIPELQALGKKKEDLAAAVRTPQGIAKIQEHLAAPAGALQTAPGDMRLLPLPSPFREVEQAKGLGSPKVSTDQMDRGPRLPRKCSPEKKPPRHSAQPGHKAPLPGSPEAWKKDRGALGRRMRESVQELHALGKPEHRRAGSLRAPRSPARAHVRLPAQVAVWETSLQPLRFSTGHFPSTGVEQPKDIGYPEARGVQADRGLRGPPKPWPARGLSESGAEPQEKAAPLTNKRKRGLPEPTPEVWKKLRTFLSANMPKAPQKKDKLAGSVGVPRPPLEVQERWGTPAEGPAPRQTQAGLRTAARDTTRKADKKPAEPIPTGTSPRVAGALRPPAPWRQWRPEREGLKRKAQREREIAAKYTALDKRNFFEERQKDMDIARYYVYMV